MKNIFKFLFNTLYRVEISGLENFQKAGSKVLVVANHTSFLDAALLATYLPDDLGFAINTHIAKKAFFKPFLKLAKTYPIDPTSPYSTKTLIELVRNENKCVIFPEGRITVTGSLMKIYEGPGMIADKASANILPIKIEGAMYTPFSRMKGKIKTHFFPKIRIKILPPVKIEIPSEIKGRERRKQSGQKLYDVMKEMMFNSTNINQTLFESLIEAAQTNGLKHPIAEDVNFQPINYRKLLSGCFALGKKFTKHTNEGDIVGVALPNSNANLITFFALQAYNLVPAMLNYSAGLKNLQSACATAKIKTIITSKNFIEKAKLGNSFEALEQTGIKLIYLEDVKESLTTIQKLFALLKASFSNLFYKKANPNNKAVILFTSGSEGSPKAVVLSHKNINANRTQIASVIDFNSTDKVLNALPMFHSFGLTGATLLPVLAGVKIFFYPSPLHYRIVPEMVYDRNATIVFGTDTFLSGYAKFAHPYDFYSVRYVFAGAEKLKDETRKLYAEKYGVRIFEGYGATETSPALSLNTPMHNKAGTVGKLLPGIIPRLEKIDGIDDGARLYVSGANIMLGYYLENNPAVLIPPINNEYDTGDIVSIDHDGYIKICGRAKRFAKIAGEMVSLTMVESYLKNLFPQYDHAVVNIPDDKKGEQIILFTTKPSLERNEISTHTKANGISELAVPKKFNFLDKLPVLGTGKTDYVTLKEMALSL